MPQTYTAREAKAKFDEVIRKVRAGERVAVTLDGDEITLVAAPPRRLSSFEARIRELEAQGVIQPGSGGPPEFKPIVRRPGALKRFLESRE